MGHTQRRRLEETIARELFLATMMLLVALLQAAIPPRPIDLMPHILLLLVICRSLVRGSENAVRWAFYGGLGIDICNGTTLGIHAVALVLAILAARLALAQLTRTSWLTPLIGVPLGMLAYYSAMAVLLSLTVAPIDLPRYTVITVLPQLLATLVPALPAFLLMRWATERQRGSVAIDIY
jgi:rod shape-determining protein MreD